MAISVTPVLPVQPAQEVAVVTPELVLRPGSTIDATVLKVLSADLVRIAIASLSIDVKTEIPLQQGQALKLAVSQTENGIRLTNVSGNAVELAPDAVTLSPDALLEAPIAPSANAAPKAVLTPLEKATITIAAQTAATEQGSQAPLFANLASIANSPALPPKLQQAIREVLAQQTGLDPNLDGADIKAAFKKSGLFLEASLAAGTVPSSGGAPDLKAALLVLRQTLQTVLGGQSQGQVTLPRGDAATALLPTGAQEFEMQEILLPQARVPVAEKAGDFVILARAGFSGIAKDAAPSTAALNLLQQVGSDPAQVAKAATAFRTMQGEDVQTNTPPPPFRGALPSAQSVASASIAPETPLAPAAHHLLADTDAAIARQTLLQVASLPDRIDALPQPAQSNDTTGPRWNFEVPFATPQGTAMAQFEISRDGGGTETEAAKKVWRARFTLDVEPSGPVHALIALVGEKTSVRMWAERPATAEKLRAGSAELGRALAQAELKPGDIVVRDGTPPQPQATSSGHFLDRAL
jgi:flagellar hook-length control protein FliK